MKMNTATKIMLVILTGGLAIVGFVLYAIFKAKNEETVECEYVEGVPDEDTADEGDVDINSDEE